MKHIIKNGTRQEITCGTCGCLFSYEEEDTRRIVGSHLGTLILVDCPQCGNIITIRNSKLFNVELIERGVNNVVSD